MKWMPLIPAFMCLLIPACKTSLTGSATDSEMYRRAFSPSFGGREQRRLTYQGRSLLVVFKCHNSGVATSEPFVFVQTTNSWHCLYHHDTVDFEMDATVEGNRLVLWHLEWYGGILLRTQFWMLRTEFWSYDLNHLGTA